MLGQNFQQALTSINSSTWALALSQGSFCHRPDLCVVKQRAIRAHESTCAPVRTRMNSEAPAGRLLATQNSVDHRPALPLVCTLGISFQTKRRVQCYILVYS